MSETIKTVFSDKSTHLKTLTILLAHGSSDLNWSATFERMTRDTCESLSDVVVAYMELSTPSLESVIRRAASNNYNHITVLPLFLAAGKHLKIDIPKILDTLKEELDISYSVLPPIGEHPMMASTIKAITSEAAQQM